MLRTCSIFTLLVVTATAAAEPVGLASEPARRREPVDVVRVPRRQEDPRPTAASGVEIEDQPPARGARWVPRALLFVPKLVLLGALQPVRGFVYLSEREGSGSGRPLGAPPARGTVGGYPVARYQSELGGTIGARINVKNALGDGERLALRADFGGEVTYGLGAEVTSGERFGSLALSLGAGIDLHPHDLYFGVGNTTGIETRFRQEVIRQGAGARLALGENTALELTTMWTRRAFSSMSMDDVNEVSADAAVEFDTRRAASVYATQTIAADGWMVRGHAGPTVGLGDTDARYLGYGAEVEHCLDVFGGTRTLSLRLKLEGLIGMDDRIPFTDLPRLGGADDLRGYAPGRFRDRAIGLASAEYSWRLINQMSAFTFVDVGEPFATFDEAFDGPVRVGAGAGLQLHTKHTFLGRAQVAASRDGDVMVTLLLQPTSGRRERGKY